MTRSAVARLHRPQRRLSGQRGRPARRSGDRHRRALRRPLGVVVDAGLFLELPAHASSSTSISIRPSSAATIRPISASSPTRARSCASCWPRLDAPPRHRGDASRRWLAEIAALAAEWDEFTRPNFEIHALADPAGARRRRLPGGAAGRRHSRLRRRRQPQLVHAVLEGAPAADHAQLLGLLRHGLRRGGRARRQARGARPACASRSSATAASPWCRTCSAPRSNTTSRWCG